MKLIVEMEMPRNCQECPLLHALYLYGSKYCGANGVAYEKEHYKLKRPDQCPIVGELPDEHGDLIDSDELKEQFVDNGQDIDTLDVIDIINNAPAVIAAERKDDE